MATAADHPMRSRLLFVLAVFSMILCLGFLTLWPRSYWRSDAVRGWYPARPDTCHFLILYSGRGGLMLNYQRDRFLTPKAPPPLSFWYGSETYPDSPDTPLPNLASSFSLAGLGYQYTRYPLPPHLPPARPSPTDLRSEAGLALQAPYWFLVLLMSVLPLLHLRRHVRTLHRTRIGLCPACGYDLRASPDRCPECGTIAPSPRSARSLHLLASVTRPAPAAQEGSRRR